MRGTQALMASAACAVAVGCSEPKPTQPPPISQKVRVENMSPRIEKAFALSEAESLKIVLIPGFPFGERCVVYSSAASHTMQCREVLPHNQ